MSAVAAHRPEPFDARSTNAILTSWGNWYIKRTAHEFGWSSHYACLNYYGLISRGHKILFDAPSTVRLADVAVGQLPAVERHALVLKYCWHRDLRTGVEVMDLQRADAMGVSYEKFRALTKVAQRHVAKVLGEIHAG